MIPIAAIASIASTAYGAVQEGRQRRKMEQDRQKWTAENEAQFNQDYYSDYTKRADTQSVLKNLRDETRKQNQQDQNIAAVTGASPEAINAGKERRNKAISNVYSNISARGAEWKERAKNRYLARKQALQGMDYDVQALQAQSANNLMYNGLTGLSTTDWASILKGGAKSKYNTNGIENYFNKDGNILPLPTPVTRINR